LAAIASAAVAVGLLQMPFGYYTLLRVVICLTSVAGVAAARRRGDGLWVWMYAVLVVVYNPVLPLTLGSKSLWIGLNFITIACFWVGALRFRSMIPKAS